AIVSFRRGSGTSVSGDIVFQNTASASANYAHTYQGSDPALLAGGKISMISSGASAGRTSTSITGIVYTFAGSDIQRQYLPTGYRRHRHRDHSVQPDASGEPSRRLHHIDGRFVHDPTLLVQ